MAQTTINNGDSGSTVRTALNNMFTELYTGEGRGFQEKLAYSGGTVSPGGETDPAVINTITHTFSGSYSSAPHVIIIPKCDWWIYISSVSTTQVVIASGSFGGASVLDYDLLVTKAI
jgi:hypothetical protein